MHMTLLNALKLLVVTTPMLLLVGCEIDQGGGPNPPQVTQSAAVTYGPIDGFGSIVVNGDTISTTTAPVLINGVAAAEADLKVGQVVRVESLLVNSTASASLVEYQASVIGPVSAIDAATGVLGVLGQSIAADASVVLDIPGVATLADINVGAVIEVSALTRPDGSMFATYLGAPAANTVFTLGTTISAVDLGLMQFTLGGIVIDYSQANVIDLVGGQPAVGQIVAVIGTSFGNAGELIADQVLQLGADPGLFSLSDTDLASSSIALGQNVEFGGFDANFVGFIETSDNASTLTINDVVVSFDGNTTIVNGGPGDLNADTLVQIKGEIVSPGIVSADEITIM